MFQFDMETIYVRYIELRDRFLFFASDGFIHLFIVGIAMVIAGLGLVLNPDTYVAGIINQWIVFRINIFIFPAWIGASGIFLCISSIKQYYNIPLYRILGAPLLLYVGATWRWYVINDFPVIIPSVFYSALALTHYASVYQIYYSKQKITQIQKIKHEISLLKKTLNKIL